MLVFDGFRPRFVARLAAHNRHRIRLLHIVLILRARDMRKYIFIGSSWRHNPSFRRARGFEYLEKATEAVKEVGSYFCSAGRNLRSFAAHETARVVVTVDSCKQLAYLLSTPWTLSSFFSYTPPPPHPGLQSGTTTPKRSTRAAAAGEQGSTAARRSAAPPSGRRKS